MTKTKIPTILSSLNWQQMILIWSYLLLTYVESISCIGDSQCKSQIIKCRANQDCIVDCAGSQACRSTIIQCPIDYECRIICHNIDGMDPYTNTLTCFQMIINATQSSTLTLLANFGDLGVLDNALRTLEEASIYCPIYGRNNPSCQIICDGDDLIRQSQIYSVAGFNGLDITSTFYNAQWCIRATTVHCTPDFSYSCSMTNVAPFQCQQKSNQQTDTTCETYTLSPTLPTTSPIHSATLPTPIPITPTNNPTLRPTNPPLLPDTPTTTPTIKPTRIKLCCACTIATTTAGCPLDLICERIVCATDIPCCSNAFDLACVYHAKEICDHGTESPTTGYPTYTSNMPTFSPTQMSINPTTSLPTTLLQNKDAMSPGNGESERNKLSTSQLVLVLLLPILLIACCFMFVGIWLLKRKIDGNVENKKPDSQTRNRLEKQRYSNQIRVAEEDEIDDETSNSSDIFGTGIKSSNKNKNNKLTTKGKSNESYEQLSNSEGSSYYTTDDEFKTDDEHIRKEWEQRLTATATKSGTIENTITDNDTDTIDL